MGMGDNALQRDCIAMPAMTIQGLMPTTSKTKKQASSKSHGSKRRRSLNAILGENRTFKAWLRLGKDSPSEAFVILAEGLSSKDREFLASAADLVVDPGEDLLSRIAAL